MTKESYTEAVLAGIDAALQAQARLTITSPCTAPLLNNPLWKQIGCGSKCAVCCDTTCSSKEATICPAAPCEN